MKIMLSNSPALKRLEGNQEKYFVKAGSRWPFSVVKKRDQRLIDYVPFPFYLAYTAALLDENNFDISVLDGVALNLDHEDFIYTVIAEKPDILLIESTTPTFDIDLINIKKIKEKIDCIVCMSGSHVTSFPEEVLLNHDAIDYIFQGEYEFSFLDFCMYIRDGKQDELNLLQSIAYKEDSNRIFKAPKGLIENLDDLPFPLWEQFPKKGLKTWDYYWDNICQNKPAAQMHSSRGCPFRCDFCVWIQVMYDNSNHRSFSPKRIVDEMVELEKRFGIKEVYFDDDIFTGNKKHIHGFCKEIEDRHLKIKWSAMGDAMACNSEDAKLMAKAGLIGYKFGVESGDVRVLKEIQKPVKLDAVKDLCKTFNKCGVKTHGTFSFGLSGESKDSMNNTLKFMKALTVDTLQVSIATPFPGTRFFEKVKTQKQIVDLTWDEYDGANSSVISYDNLSNIEIQEFSKYALRSWLISRLFSPGWIWRQIKIMSNVLRGQGVNGVLRIAKTGLRILLP